MPSVRSARMNTRLRIIAGVLSLCFTTPVQRAQAQAQGEIRIQEALARMLGTGAGDTFDVERSYSRLYFPRTVFYRARFAPPGIIDANERHAAIALVDSTQVIVASAADLRQLWRAAITQENLVPADVLSACTDLMQQVGLVSQRARFIERSEEIPATLRKLLSPPEGVTRVRPPTAAIRNGRVEGTRFIWDEQLLQLQCVLDRDNELTVEVDTVAKTGLKRS